MWLCLPQSTPALPSSVRPQGCLHGPGLGLPTRMSGPSVACSFIPSTVHRQTQGGSTATHGAVHAGQPGTCMAGRRPRYTCVATNGPAATVCFVLSCDLGDLVSLRERRTRNACVLESRAEDRL